MKSCPIFDSAALCHLKSTTFSLKAIIFFDKIKLILVPRSEQKNQADISPPKNQRKKP